MAVNRGKWRDAIAGGWELYEQATVGMEPEDRAFGRLKKEVKELL